MAPEPGSRWVVLTTINEPSRPFSELLARLGGGWSVVVVGDVKTPAAWRDQPIEFLSIDRQLELFGDAAAAAPRNHYCRKNFGYLYAAQRGATCILETDDDNLPYASFGRDLSRTVRGRRVGGGGWVNVYRWFTDRLVWPRGVPLDAIHQAGELVTGTRSEDCPVQQFLVDDDPDVDAIFRLVFPGMAVRFDPARLPLSLEPGTWCPFNSQNTLWFEEAFPLLYLPHRCTMRVTDIWRSLVAQRALWLAGRSIAFHPPSASQERNPHDLLRDFTDEVPGYVQNRAIAACLERSLAEEDALPIARAGASLWRTLVEAGFLPPDEVASIESWFAHWDGTVSGRATTAPGAPATDRGGT